MANIRPRKNKNGEITSYQIRVFKGRTADGKELKPYTTTFKPDPNRTERQNQKALTKFALEFEEKCKKGMIADENQTFAEYAEYVLKLKERTGTKHTTIFSYRGLLPLINEHIGFMKLTDIRPQHLNRFYETISREGIRKKQGRCTAKIDIKALIKEKGVTMAATAEKAGIAINTLRSACQGHAIYEDRAKAIAEVLDIPFENLFDVKRDNTPFSAKTIKEYHNLISTILAQADKEMLIPFNPAYKATPPKIVKKDPNYFQPEEIEKMMLCLSKESIKWRTVTHLLIASGIRRGELCGLKWSCVNLKEKYIFVSNNLVYTPDKGLYDSSTKTGRERFVDIPVETVQILKEYRIWYKERKAIYGDMWHEGDYLFFQEKTGNVGLPIHPDAINSFLDDFSRKNGLPHINPHAFRHTQASVLFFMGMDEITISKRLGHQSVQTTTDIYSHLIKLASHRSAKLISKVYYHSNYEKDLDEDDDE